MVFEMQAAGPIRVGQMVQYLTSTEAVVATGDDPVHGVVVAVDGSSVSVMMQGIAQVEYVETPDARRKERLQSARRARRAWEDRVLARLDNPTEDDRAEAAEMAAWMKRTLGDVLPLP